MPSRRRLLLLTAAGICGTFAGCIEPGGALQMTETETDAAIGREATDAIDSNRDTDAASILEEARADGSTTVEGERPPFRPDRPVAFRDAVYDVSWDVVDERTETGYVVIATIGAEDVDPELTFDELPAFDRDKLTELPARVEEFDATEDEAPRLAVRIEYYEDEADLEASVLVPEQEYDAVEVDGVPVELETGMDETTVQTYRYDVAERAPSLSAYGTELRPRQFVLESLSDDERELVEEAIADGQAVVGLDDEAFVGVGERLLEEEPIYEDDYTGEWLVEYDGTSYWVELDALRTQQLVEQLGDDE